MRHETDPDPFNNIGNLELRRLSCDLMCDVRSIRREIRQPGAVRGVVGERIRRALRTPIADRPAPATRATRDRSRAAEGEPLSAATLERLTKHVQAHGARTVRLACDVSRPTLASALAGLGLRRGTRVLIEAGLAVLEDV